MEYVGEVLDPFAFHERVEEYSKRKLEHHYFLALKSDEIIDATMKGNATRCINHSCDPNSETQKVCLAMFNFLHLLICCFQWIVKGEIRIGFFSIRQISAGEEITFDYQFQRYG